MSAYKFFTFIFIWSFVAIKTSADISLAKTLQRQDLYKNSQIYFNNESEKNGTLFYMLCNRSTEDMSCTIFREEHYVDKLPMISPCNVTFKVEDPYVRLGETVRVWPLNPSIALVLWVSRGAWGTGYRSGPIGIGEASLLKYTKIDFGICKTSETTLKTSAASTIQGWAPINYPDGETIVKSAGFVCYDKICDISFHDWQCGTSFCKLSIDRNTGEVTSNPVFWYSTGIETIDIVPKNPKDPRKGNFFFDWKDRVIYKFKSNRGLVRFPNDAYNENWPTFRHSVRKNFITVCTEIEETKVKCDQINYKGHITMHKIFDLQKKNVAPVPYTLRDGGFLLLTTECASNCTEKATNHIYKVDTDGNLSKLMDIQSLSCNANEFTHWHKFFENEQKNLCVSLLCYDSKVRKSEALPVWKSVSEYVRIDVHTNTPEEVRVQCLNMYSV